MLFAIGTVKPSVDMVGRLPEKHRHYNDPCEILYRNLSYCSQSKPTNTHGTYCTFFDATPTSRCTVYCIVACTPARHDCFTDASRTQADGAFILQIKRSHCAYISPPVPQTFVPKHREAEATWNHELETSRQTEPKQPQPKQTEPKQPQPKQTEPKQPQPKQPQPKQKRGHLHSAAPEWRAFANPKARFLILSTSFGSPEFSNLKPFVLVLPAASIHRQTIRWLRLS